MQLPRYPIARTKTQELSRAAASAITPAEAARAQIAKFGAIGAVGEAISKVAQVEAQARAEEEYTDAVFDYETQVQEYDIQQETKGFERDENDNIIVDDKQMIKDELTARKKISETIRNNLSSRSAKQNYDKYMMQSNLRRNMAYTQRAVERRTKALGAQAEYKVETLIQQGLYDAALERARAGVDNGVLSQAKFDTLRLKINQDRTKRYVFDTIETGTHQDLMDAVEALDEGTYNGNDLGIDADTNYMLRARVTNKLASLDEDAFTATDKEREDLYMKMIEPAINGEISIADINTLRYQLDAKRYDKLIGYASTASKRPQDSDPNVLDEYETRIRELRVGYGYDPTVGYGDTVQDTIEAMALDPNLSMDDVDKLTTKLEGYVDAIREDDELEIILDVEMTKIIGRKVDQFEIMFEGRNRDNEIIAARLERDFKRAMTQKGPKDIIFNGEEWMRENVSKYHVQAQTKMLKDYDIIEVPKGADGKPDINMIGVMMEDYNLNLLKTDQSGQMTESKARQQAEFDFQTYKRLIEAG